jgi:hypothetical protein
MKRVSNTSGILWNRNQSLTDSEDRDSRCWHPCFTNQSINQTSCTTKPGTAILRDCNYYVDQGHTGIAPRITIGPHSGTAKHRKASYAGAAHSSVPANSSDQIHRDSVSKNLCFGWEKASRTKWHWTPSLLWNTNLDISLWRSHGRAAKPLRLLEYDAVMIGTCTYKKWRNRTLDKTESEPS